MTVIVVKSADQAPGEFLAFFVVILGFFKSLLLFRVDVERVLVKVLCRLKSLDDLRGQIRTLMQTLSLTVLLALLLLEVHLNCALDAVAEDRLRELRFWLLVGW